MPEIVTQSVMDFTDFLARYFAALAAVGALAMALIELWKKVRGSEARFQAKRLADWIRDDHDMTQDKLEAYAELIHLTIGVSPSSAQRAAQTMSDKGRLGGVLVPAKPEYGLFAQPLEQMVAHMQNAADTAINLPERYPNLFAFLTSGAMQEDRDARIRQVKNAADPADPDYRADLARRADTYARLQQAARHKIDAFQTYTDERWTNWNQRRANVVGALVLAAALLASAAPELGSGGALLKLLFFSALGGILSPIAKDIVTALGKVRAGA
jgi:hypothetical protein